MMIEVGVCIIPNMTVIAHPVLMMVNYMTRGNGRTGNGKDLFVFVNSFVECDS